MSDIHSTGNPLSVSALADENAIRTSSHVFSDAVNRRKYDLFRSIWSEDAVWCGSMKASKSIVSPPNRSKSYRIGFCLGKKPHFDGDIK
jgi:hypothetical protein